LVNLQKIVRQLTLEVPLSLGFGAVQKRACDFWLLPVEVTALG
jgi:hypothetical protein